MNTPLVLASVVLLAGVAARPIDTDRSGDELHEFVHSPNHNTRQAFLGRIPAGFDSLNSVQLHDIHDKTHVQAEDNAAGCSSPKLTGAEGPSVPDPGLDSPYIGPQRHLTNIEQELEVSTLSPTTSPADFDSSPIPKTERAQSTSGTTGEVNHSPMVVPLVFASFASLVLLGLVVAGVYTIQLLRHTLVRYDVWQSVSKEKIRVSRWEKEEVDVEKRTLQKIEGRVASGEALHEPVLAVLESTNSDLCTEDPELMSLPENPPEFSRSSVPTMRHQSDERSMRLVFTAWTYDNWITHIMVALFGWFGTFLGHLSRH